MQDKYGGDMWRLGLFSQALVDRVHTATALKLGMDSKPISCDQQQHIRTRRLLTLWGLKAEEVCVAPHSWVAGSGPMYSESGGTNDGMSFQHARWYRRCCCCIPPLLMCTREASADGRHKRALATPG